MPSRTSSRSGNRGSFTTVAVLLLSVLLVAGCGGIEGKYSHEEQTPEGSMKLTLELRGGDKAVMTMSGGPGGGSMSTEGTYKVEGDKVSVAIAGDTEVFTRSGNRLIGRGFGESVELVKE